MIALGRLPTCDRLFRLGFGENQLSFLCGLVNESLDHILHNCDFVQEMMSMLFRAFGDMFFGCSIQEAIIQFAHYNSKKNWKDRLRSLCWVEMLFMIWSQHVFLERSTRVQLLKAILFRVTSRASSPMVAFLHR